MVHGTSDLLFCYTPRVCPPGILPPGDTIIRDPRIPSDFPADLAPRPSWGWGFGTLYEGALAVCLFNLWP